ncbi:MAG TPA: methyl-accepting chemotaxis protein, partial [Bryobacteraceae bacterium]|nr:methyl-accepting chemotaxis protein [Bryobacteraceae bacterium]
MKKLENIRIGKKLTILLAVSLSTLIGVGIVSLWAILSIRGAAGQEREESSRMMTAQKLSGDLGRVDAIVGHITLSKHCQGCHETAAGGSRENYSRTVQETSSLLGELQAAVNPAEGRKLIDSLVKASSTSLQTNSRALELQQSAKTSEAAALYCGQSLPDIAQVDQSLQDYLTWERSRLAEKRQRTESLSSGLPVLLTLLSLLGGVLAAAIGWAVYRSIRGPLAAAVSYLEKVAGGDLAKDVTPEHLARRDEIGALAKAVQQMTESLRGVVQGITEEIGVLSTSSSELTASSAGMSDGSQQASDKAHAVAAAAEEMSANVTSVASGMEQTTTNLTSVASATEQMTATIGEIAGNSEKARRITEEATR